jgi:hypothetical protein
MANSELGAVFKGLAEDADRAGGRIAESLGNTLEIESATARAFRKIMDDGDTAAEPAPAPAPTGPADPGTEPPVPVKIWREPRMPKTQFARKAAALRRLGDDGQLYKAKNPVARDPEITKRYRQDVIDRIYRQYNEQNPELADRLIDRVARRMSPDHVHELQLGGPDTPENLRCWTATLMNRLAYGKYGRRSSTYLRARPCVSR